MNDVIMRVGASITEYLLKEFPKEYLMSVFGDRLQIDDLVDQIIFECIKHAFDETQEKHSIRYFLKQNGDDEKDDVRMRYSRLMAIAKSYKKREIEYLSSFGNSDLLAEAVTKMDDISDKLDGYKLSEMNFFELTNIGELELVKAVVNHRISSSKKISNDKFKEIANQYDKYVISWRELANDSDANKVFYSLAYFTIEWKYAFNFLHHCVKEMEKAGVKDEKVAVNKIGMLLGYRYIMSILGFHMSIDSRMVGYREGLIADFFKNPEIECQYREMLALLAAFKENMSIDDIPIKDWFVKNTNVSDWASFFNEYDVFKSYESSVNWTGKHIGTMRKMYAEIFPENPENRSYKSDFDFDTIMISNLKEELNMDKFECYIEEYQNEKGQLCARIRDKKSNKRVEMIGETFVYNHFLRFLSQAKVNIDIMPTVYDRNGKDIVSVRGTKQSEDDECIVVSLIGSGAGYVFE